MILLLACTGAPIQDSDPDSDAVEDSAVCEQLRCEDGICWQGFCGGSFTMGSKHGVGDKWEWPPHSVTVQPFEIARTEVTVAQYEACVAEGACELWPASGETPASCNQWASAERQDHPQNCVDWPMAADFCWWAGGRLPSEAEWEYAARSGGRVDKVHPWGEKKPDCERANFKQADGACGSTTEPVCSRPAGDTEQGLCDMGGNAFEWVADWFHSSYDGAPRDGSAWMEPVTEFKTMRGGGIGSGEDLRTRNRTFHEPHFSYGGMGFRCAR